MILKTKSTRAAFFAGISCGSGEVFDKPIFAEPGKGLRRRRWFAPAMLQLIPFDRTVKAAL
jgi:hypothetical protein